MRHIKATNTVELPLDSFSIFLGGSIEINTAENWQEQLAMLLSNHSDDVILLNPRRDNWDNSWTQDPTPGTPFHEQVSWELSYQEQVDLLVYYFDPATKSPITLMELGAYGMAVPESTVVCCPSGYWRYGNVAMFCNRYGIQLLHNIDDLAVYINESILERI